MEKTFPASLDSLYEMLATVVEFAKSKNFNESQINKIELATEEALVNIISYAYPNSDGPIHITCHNPNQAGIQIIIKDKGIAYNPLVVTEDSDPSHPLDRIDVGGYGIHFILNIMDEVTYQRIDNQNVLTMIKYLK